jgi:erythronate-4-phosphate dehydrogenase
LCRSVYDPRRDDADFRRSLVGTVEVQRKAFDLLRKHYPARREVDGLKVRINGESAALASIVSALGATVI